MLAALSAAERSHATADRSSAPYPPRAIPAAADRIDDKGVYVFLLTKVNGNPRPELVRLEQRGRNLYMLPETARKFGFRADYLERISPDTPLSDYPGIQVVYDESRQTLDITAPLQILDLETKILGPESRTWTRASVSPGLLFNYDLYSSFDSHNARVLNMFSELRAFNEWGTASTTYLSKLFQPGDGSASDRSTVRMDSRLEYSWQDTRVTLRLGDTLTSGLPWTRQTLIGGVHIARDFSLQPYRVTAPLPAYFGAVTQPSSVQLYVDGIRQYSGQVPAGPFQLNFQPSVNGAGRAQVVMTDALGRSTSVQFPFYATSRLLRAGLADWSFEAGYVREGYGYDSFDYGRALVTSGTLRHGLTDRMTVSGHVEYGDGIAMGGAGVDLLVGNWGTVSASAAGSRGDGSSGSQHSLGYQLQRGAYSLGWNTQRANRRFRDVASRYGSSPALRSDSAYAGVSVASIGNFSVNYARFEAADRSGARYAGLSWSRSLFRGATLSLAATQNLNDRRDRTITLSLIANLGSGVSGYAAATRTHDGSSRTVSASGGDIGPDTWNWNLRAQRSERHGAGTQSYTSASGEVSRQLPYADINAGINQSGSTRSVHAHAAGSIVAMGGGIFAARRIYDGFAVVSTDSVPDIPVFAENRPVGHTDGNGLLLVPSLQAYQNNRISIDPIQLPLDMHIDQVRMNVVPRRNSGVKVTFGMQRVRAASLIVYLPDGIPVPLGTAAYLNDSAEASGWVGYDGRLYLEGLQNSNRVRLQGKQLDCTIAFTLDEVADAVPEIGPFSCVH